MRNPFAALWQAVKNGLRPEGFTELPVIPAELSEKTPSIRMAGNLELQLDGCVGISHYGEDCVTLRLSGKYGALTVRGERLCLVAYHRHCVGIRGKIRAVEIEA